MSCGAPLFSYSRFRDGDEDDDEPQGSGLMTVLVIVLLLAAAVGMCYWCMKSKRGGCAGGCGSATLTQSGGASAGAIEVASYEALIAHTRGQRCVVMFHAVWCGHCKATKPAFHAAASRTSTPFLLVDCEQIGMSQDQMRAHGITGFPTIVLMRDGQKIGDYAGDRSEGDLVAFATS